MIDTASPLIRAAVFTACYSDWKLIRTRATVQIVLEIPVERADAAYQVLGGMPVAGKEIWVAIARLSDDLPETDTNIGGALEPSTLAAIVETRASASPRGEPITTPCDPIVSPAFSRRRFSSLPLPQQAAMLCQETAFRIFLAEKYNAEAFTIDGSTDTAFKNLLNINSKRDLNQDNHSGREFMLMRDKYLAWKRVA